MNETPRRGPGGFPGTPQTNRTPGMRTSGYGTPSRPNVRTPLNKVPEPAPQTSNGPVIPTHVLDAAQQRFYVFAFYMALWAWRMYDFYNLVSDDQEAFWQFLKWLFIDIVFLFCVPLLEIPWLEWGIWVSVFLFGLHFVLDYMLMYRIGIPFQAWTVGLAAWMWDRELAIDERSVKPGAILHNASLILGKQIINILPEGSAILNPTKQPFCLNSTVTHLDIPIVINQTNPTEIEMVRIDLETNEQEPIIIKARECKSMLKKARKAHKKPDPASPLELHYSVKKTGVYMLKRIIDESKLEVRPRGSSAVVVTCPKARVVPTGGNRCRNDLSNILFEVEGVPPLRLRYRTNVGAIPREATELQGLLPDGYSSPLSKHTSQALIRANREDVTWALSQKVGVPLNETLSASGVYTYAVEEVTDAIGNHVNFLAADEEDRPKLKPAAMHTVTVHERPKVSLKACNAQNPLQVAKGEVIRLPLHYQSSGKGPIECPHIIEYLFTPEEDLLSTGDHASTAQLKRETMRTNREQPLVSASGLYTLKSVSTDFCEGEVLEPASCLLRNPPEPELTITKEDMVDKCAGNPIGLRVALDLIGTPPFHIKYREQRAGKQPSPPQEIQVKSLRSTIELVPREAGHYTYTFLSIRDWVYGERPLQDLELQQEVKPAASARFIDADGVKQVCIEDTAEFDVALSGEGPFTLDYEIVHNGKRTKRSVSVEGQHYTITTPKLNNGGEYIISLASVTDKMNCKEFLKAEAKLNVRHERPKAYFGQIDGKQAIMALEGKKVQLPLRLTGSGPWQLQYENLDTNEVQSVNIRDANTNLPIENQGTYQLLRVRDSVCPGFIDERSSQFSVGWISRPSVSIPESSSMTLQDGKYLREDVCEGDEDSFDVVLQGNAPFELSYEQQFRDLKSGKPTAIRKKDIRALGGSASIRADTAQPGTYNYKFVKLSDNKYDHSARHFSPLFVQQTVNPRPLARFDNPGKTYSYCSRESDGEEVIPITLEGAPPFYLEIDIKHHGTPKSEISSYKNINKHKYDLKIEHRKLNLGHSTITIRKIRDARGCTHKPLPGGPRVQISVHDAPTATAMEDRTDFCVGDRLSFALGGQVPFTVFYTFESQERKATNAGTTFRRLAELPGTFSLAGLKDSASTCIASLNLTKIIHPIPTVRLSGGMVSQLDIHEGTAADLEFSFTGTPPFEFTYTRSTNEVRGRKSRVLDVKTEVSEGYHLSIPVNEEGTYEVVSIKDRWCSFARQVEGLDGVRGKGQKLLKY
ncbi:hypothetical protein M011DRAFT_415052 [Sporormia fimetaria CBS 119925]|uniref:Nucleoporin Pom152 n=1 Tax=Sporormia fimetaria CBS 119925 TaxID=1340428 RepID=A0A6A6VQZ8_9PLEO|nr:hypothetical protein M011DRAFT_415052 [Sporormia fimetaria CBS 119925]